MPACASCSATMKRDSAEAMTVGLANTASSATRRTVAWKVEVAGSTSGVNCFGMLSREAGHSRVPDPPHRITGRIFSWSASAIAQSVAYREAPAGWARMRERRARKMTLPS